MHHVIVPGIHGSDDRHWQSIWQGEWGSAASRISPSSWDEPDLDDWCEALDRSVAEARSTDVVVVAHSLGCLAAVAWAAHRHPNLRGLFLVAPPDSAASTFPRNASTFGGSIPQPPPAPGLIVYSENDLYCSPDASARIASSWQFDHISAGFAGHINSASQLGRWNFGRALFTAFAAGVAKRTCEQVESA